jgi:hypothetical protein
LKPLLQQNGRSIDDLKIHVGIFDQDMKQNKLKQYRDAGTTQVILFTRSENLDDLYRDLDKWAKELVVPGQGM